MRHISEGGTRLGSRHQLQQLWLSWLKNLWVRVYFKLKETILPRAPTMSQSPLFVIGFTPAAVKHIMQKIDHKQAKAFRLSVKTTGCSGLSYVPEIVSEPREGDIFVQDGSGLKVYIAQDSTQYLQGVEVDHVIKSLGHSLLIFKNPQADSVCGCGESFHIKPKEGGV